MSVTVGIEYDLHDLKENEMKELAFEDQKIVVVKHKDQIFAASGKCTHYGAPLVNGVFSNGIIRCPWHGACFNVQNGDIEDFPGLDNLTSFKIEPINGSKYKICKKNGAFERPKIGQNETIVIIGGGPCGLECAEMLRKENYVGNITIISKDSQLPYDRPKLSKALPTDVESILLRKIDFFSQHKIEIVLGKTVNHIDFANKRVQLSDSSNYKYDKLMLATGATPFVPPIPGNDLKNILTLRCSDDAQNIARLVKPEAAVVIIGSSFIGMELAACLAGKVKSITVVDKGNVPFENSFGKEVGAFIKNMHVEKGVTFEHNTQLVEFQGNSSGEINHVSLSNGKTLPCDFCILGVGVRPETRFLTDQSSNSDVAAKLGLDPKTGFLEVNENLATNIPDVFAGGDIVKFPLFLEDGKKVNIQHWQMALKHGKVAAQNMVSSRKVPLRSVPYFWTVQYGKSLRYVGYNQGYQEIIMHKDANMSKFVVCYIKDDMVKAVLTFMRDPVASIIADIFLTGKRLSKSEIQGLESQFESDGYIASLKGILAACPPLCIADSLTRNDRCDNAFKHGISNTYTHM